MVNTTLNRRQKPPRYPPKDILNRNSRKKDIENHTKPKELLRAKPRRLKKSSPLFGGNQINEKQYAADLIEGLLQIKHTEPKVWSDLLSSEPRLAAITEQGIITPNGGILPVTLIKGIPMAQISKREYDLFTKIINPVAKRRYANISGTRALIHYIAGQPVAAKTQDVKEPTTQVFYKAQLKLFFSQLHRGVQ